ncbi:MAG: hypothetical protein WDM92_00195 [Caulobacteraceae bacterium]
MSAPSLLLQRRPDIAAAERRAAAANARNRRGPGVFPSISLGGAGGLETAGQGVNLLTAASSWWTLGPTAA